MRRREAKGGAPPTDLLVCFPARAHLNLMPKAICSPARPSEPSKRHLHNSSLSRSSNNRGGQASPLLWSKTKPLASEIAEPTSPKVTCAGQIKVRHKPSSCKNWHSVMEDIERLHNRRNHQKKRPSWAESFGFKKEVMQFLTCLRGIRFDLRCFGTFHETEVITSDDDEEDAEEYEEEEEEEQENEVGFKENDGDGTSRTAFSKWLMVLQENQSEEFNSKEDQFGEAKKWKQESLDHEDLHVAPSVPPPNALLLMRCRSAPAKAWLQNRIKEAAEEEQEEEETTTKAIKLDSEAEKNKESLAMMNCYGPDFFKISPEIAKETWVVGGTRDPFSRSRSWKR